MIRHIIRKAVERTVDTAIRLLYGNNVVKGALAPSVRTVLIPLIYGIGDTAIFTVFLRGFIETYPGVRVVLYLNRNSRGLLEDTFPECVLLYAGEEKNTHMDSVDLLISPLPTLKNLTFILRFRPKYICGYPYSLAYTADTALIKQASVLAESIGINGDRQPELTLKDEPGIERKYCEPSKKNIGIIVGGRWRSRTYPAELVTILTQKLAALDGINIVLLGNDPDTTKSIMEHVSASNVKNTCGRTSLYEVIRIITACDIVVGPDSGLLNVAIALNRRICGLFGPVDPLLRVPDAYVEQTLITGTCSRQPCYSNRMTDRPCPYPDDPVCMHFEPDTIYAFIRNALELNA